MRLGKWDNCWQGEGVETAIFQMSFMDSPELNLFQYYGLTVEVYSLLANVLTLMNIIWCDMYEYSDVQTTVPMAFRQQRASTPVPR